MAGNGKSLNQLGKKQQSRKLKFLKGKAECALWFLKTHGLSLTSVKVANDETGDIHSFNFDESNKENCEVTGNDQKAIEQILHLLDKFCISDEFYHELTIMYDDLPRSYLIKQCRNNLNKVCHIERVPGPHPGTQIDFLQILQETVGEYLQEHPQHDQHSPVKIKISGDGAKISRTTNFNLLSFSVLDIGQNVLSGRGNRTIAIVNGPENYEVLKTSFKNVFGTINNLINSGEINIGNISVPIDIYLGGDYKFLLMMTGLSNATSDHACLWCKVHKLERWDMTKELEFYNSPPMARSLAEILKFASSPKSAKRYSCVRDPLLNIELDHIIIDELHLMMRVTDRLTENLINEVLERDSKADAGKKRSEQSGVFLHDF